MVTMQKRGSLSLNASAYLAMGSPKAVHLLYDRVERVIGIRPADPDDPDSYPPRTLPKRGETGPHVVTAAAFTSHYEIDTTPRRYRAFFKDGILCIDLKQPEGTEDIRDGSVNQANGATSSG
jgi:hypothetical protein